MSAQPDVEELPPPGMDAAAPGPAAPPGPRSRAGALITFVAGVALALLSPFCTRDAPVDSAVLAEVAAGLGALPPRTFVLVHPPWRTDVADALRTASPALEVGLALPPDAMEGRRPVVLLEWPHAPRPGAIRRWNVEESRDVGPARISFFHGASRVAPPPPPSVSPSTPAAASGWTLEAALPRAVVKVVGASGTVACNAWDAGGQRWTCPGMNEWNFVGPRTLPVNGQPRNCTWAHPVTGGTLSILLPAVPAGRYALGHALADGAAGIEGAADVKVAVTAGALRAEWVHANAPGWREDALEIPAGNPVDVVLDITTVHDGARHFCVALEARP